MAKKKADPNQGKHSASREAEESALHLGALYAARNTAPPSASSAAKNTASSLSENTASSLSENTSRFPPKKLASSPATSTAPTLAKKTAPASSNEDEEPVPPFPSDAAKSKAPASAKNTASASAKNKAPAPAKNKASAKNAVAVPATSNEDGVAAPPQGATLRRFINYMCEKVTSIWWQGLLDAFLTWVHGSTGDDTSESSSVSHEEEGSTHQEKRKNQKVRNNQRNLKGTNKIQQQASPHHPETTLPTDETEADRILPAGPSISQIVEDSQNFDRYLCSAIHEHYVEIMSRCPPGMIVCTFCYFERGSETKRSHSSMILHLRTLHHNVAGVKCTNCPARFPTERDRDQHGQHCKT